MEMSPLPASPCPETRFRGGAPAYESGGRAFESLRVRHKISQENQSLRLNTKGLHPEVSLTFAAFDLPRATSGYLVGLLRLTYRGKIGEKIQDRGEIGEENVRQACESFWWRVACHPE